MIGEGSFCLSSQQTKDWRRRQSWYCGGRKTECENFQVETIEKELGIQLEKTSERLHTLTFSIHEYKHPYNDPWGFDFTENFDRVLRDPVSSNTYFNFKFIVGRGGAQTRSLKDVYGFVRIQYQHVWSCLQRCVIAPRFVNILDGDECARREPMFDWLREQFPHHTHAYVYVGDLYGYLNKIRVN